MEPKTHESRQKRGVETINNYNLNINLNRNTNPPYPHEVKFTPTYVIERLNKTQVLQSDGFKSNQLKLKSIPNSTQVFNDHDLVYNQGQINDPFTYTFQGEQYTNKWSNFLSSVKMPMSIYLNENDDDDDDNNMLIKPDNSHYHDSYNLDSEWKGNQRLQAIFDYEDTNTIIEDDKSFTSPSMSSTTDPDLERQHKNWRLREREIKQRARKWIHDNKTNWRSNLINTVMENSYIPLFFRLLLIVLSAIAVGISGNLVHSTMGMVVSQQASSLMALILQAVSIVYLLYISYDEFTSQPLGLRNPKTKIRLVLLDLLFIIFSSANISLSFESMYDSSWVCQAGNLTTNTLLCSQQRTLSGILMFIIVFWCITFSISLFRIVNTTHIRNW